VAYNYLAPLLLARADTHEGLELKDMNITRDDPAQVKSIPWPRGGQLPETLSFVEIQPQNLVLSAVKRSEDGESLIVRFYNLERVEIAARITTGFPLQAAYRLNLNEERVSDLPLRGKHRVELTVKPAEVVTIELRPV
jgi:alpha-mannosidase